MRHLLIILLISISFNPIGSFAYDWMPIEWMNDPDMSDSVRIVRLDHQVLVELRSLADRLNIDWQCTKTGERIRLDLPVRSLIFTAGSPFVLADKELRQMPLPVERQGRDVLAPVEPLIAVLAEFYPGELLFDPSLPQLLVSPPRHDLFGVRYDVEPGCTRVIIPAGRLLECKAEPLPDGGVTLFFPGGKIDTASFNREWVVDLIAGLMAEQTPEGASITLKPDSGAMFCDVEKITDPPLYCVEFTGSGGMGLDREAQKRLDAEKDAWALDVVVIDPGHGGKDPGAIGPTGLYEKDVVLDVGLRLKKTLEQEGIRTVMTRDRDIFIPLSKRTQIANNSGGKLFISLHCNAIQHGRAYGVETYFLAPAKTERAMKVAMLENSVIKFEESQDQYQDLTEENYILLTMAQASFARESEQLAGMVVEDISAGLSLKDRGVDQAGFYVLIGASMPSVLVEMAFISTKSEEKKLRSKEFRQQLADQICAAVLKFLQQMK